MRELTTNERIARDAAKSSSDVPYLADDLEHYIFDMGFSAALDYSATQLAALQAERDGLRALMQRVVEGLPHSSYYQYYGDTELRQLIKDCQEALK